MNVVISICLIYMITVVLIVAVQLLKSSRKERLKQIKNFKRGKFALIYIAIFPLYVLAQRYNGTSIDGSIWNALKACFEIVVLKYDYSTVAPLMATNLLYKIAVETAFMLVALNAIMFSISFGGQRFLNFLSLFFTRLFRKKVVVVVGYNPNSVDILKSVKENRLGRAALMDKLSPEMRDDAYLSHADCVDLSKDDDLGKRFLKLFKTFNKEKVYDEEKKKCRIRRKVSVILNCEDDAASLCYVKQLYKMIVGKHLTDLPLTEPYGLQVYVFASRTNESAFTHYEEASYGLIKFINRHEQISMDFMNTHPLTEFMSDQQLDFSTATVKPDINLNVIMIGFGKLNETLFLTSVSNNQFLTIQNGELKPKAVNYHLYDRNYPEGKIAKENTSVHSRSLNHGYMRYAQFQDASDLNKENYLELVDEPARLQFHPCDIAHPDFYSSLQTTLNDPNAYSYVIVSFGTDMENIELAEKLQQKFHEWNIPSLVKIFVKVRDKKLVREIEKDFSGDLIQFFGANSDAVYNAAKILHEEMTTMARMRHLFYTAENLKRDNKAFTEEKLERLAREEWYFKFKGFQRESNIFACLSIRMKLQLLGYDCARDGIDLASEFEAKYEAGDVRTPSTLSFKDKIIWNYCNSEQQREKSLRWTYAVQEHQRWCANMICNGVIPASKEEILKEGKHALKKRLHGNLTTMGGLVEYRKLTANAGGMSEEETDVIRYDYQLMDDVVWLLHENGYKVIKKK